MISSPRLRILVRRLLNWKTVVVGTLSGAVVMARRLPPLLESVWFTRAETCLRLFWVELVAVLVVTAILIVFDIPLRMVAAATRHEMSRLWRQRRTMRSALSFVGMASLVALVGYEGYFYARGKQFGWHLQSIVQRQRAWTLFGEGKAKEARSKLRLCREALHSPACSAALRTLNARLERAQLVRKLYSALPTESIRRIGVLLTGFTLDQDREYLSSERQRIESEFPLLIKEYEEGLKAFLSGDAEKARRTLSRLNEHHPGFGDADLLARELGIILESRPNSESRGSMRAATPYLDALRAKGPAAFLPEVYAPMVAAFQRQFTTVEAVDQFRKGSD